MLNKILVAFGLKPSQYTVHPFGSGLINYTLKVSGNGQDYILQRINVNVFKAPDQIASNLNLLQAYFKNTYPDYNFVAPLPSATGDYLVKTDKGEYYRLFLFVKGSTTTDFISNKKEAFEAAKQFGKFTCMLKDFDASALNYTLTDFHNLKLRFDQFKTACQNAQESRLQEAAKEVKEVYNHYNILQNYNQLIGNNQIPVRVIHHDTKINNILFDDKYNGLCVIDLDTVMPGYFFSDVGDMMRTYLSPVTEEEKDFSKIQIREDIFDAICKGYIAEMGKILTETEKQNFIFSGKLMMYMQAIRFLTDYLNNDIYYGIKYPDHNLIRAKNQFDLLNKYINCEKKFERILAKAQDGLIVAS